MSKQDIQIRVGGQDYLICLEWFLKMNVFCNFLSFCDPNFNSLFSTAPYNMDVAAGVGGMFGQLAVGLAGGVPGAVPGVDQAMSKMGKMGVKPNIDSLPDKVTQKVFVM